jgi:hypothetical protein
VTVEVARFDRSADAGGEDQPGFFPVLPGALALSVLGNPVLSERGQTRGGQCDDPLGLVGLDGAEDELAAETLKGLPDEDDPFDQVDVFPSQSECFSTAEAEGERDGVKRI